ncbi:MAG: hypothetical protein ABI589_00215 [Burkholderiales bacterium]
MRIFETPTFDASASACLTALERRALHLLLADDPWVGQAVSGAPGLIRLEYAGQFVYYSLAPSMTELYLLDVNATKAPAPSKEELGRLKKLLQTLTTAGVIVVAKDGIKALWELIKDLIF